MTDEHGTALTDEERERLEAIEAAETLSDLATVVGADSEHEAYFAAKRDWYDLRGKQLAAASPPDGLPGGCVVVDGHEFRVHGITHADTPEEGAYLREHVSRFLEAGATVYCEQGIRPMYFAEFPAVCSMDDYRWAMSRCKELGVDSHIDELPHTDVEELVDDVKSVAEQFQETVFSLIDSGGDYYGEDFSAALGDVATTFLTSHEDVAIGENFESFAKSRRAAKNPEHLLDLQRYYERAFLPQPLEREWLRRHDRELELVTHARNERMADYAVYHHDDAEAVHLIVGAAHQPGVVDYLERHRDGQRRPSAFDPL